MTNQQKCISILRNEPIKVCYWLGFEKMTDLHNGWIKDMVFGKGDTTLLAHRGSYKTTAVSIAIAIDIILQPNLSTMFLRKTDDDVKEIVEQVRKILLSPTMQYFAYTIYGTPLKLLKSNADEIVTSLVTRTSGTVQLRGAGIKGNLTGKHFDRIRTDDIVTLQDRISRADRNFTKQIYMELENIVNRDSGGRVTNTATPWHKEDAISTLMPNIKRYNCYSTGLLTREAIEDKRIKMTPSLFAANYELKHIADGDAIFSTAKFYKDSWQHIFEGIGHIDAGYGGTDGTALTIMKKQDNGRIICLGKRWDKHVDECLQEIYAYMEHYRAGSIHLETNADKGYLANKVQKDGHWPSRYHESANKFIKIVTHLRGHWPDIYWLEDTDPDYINEILDYTESAGADDCPDSAASAVRILTTGDTWEII